MGGVSRGGGEAAEGGALGAQKEISVEKLATADLGGAILHELRLPTYAKYKEVRVVGEFELQRVTQEGWVLLAIVTEQQTTSTTEQVPNSGQYGGTIGIQKTMLQTITRYVVGRDEESALGAMKAEVLAAQEKARENSRALEDLAASEKKLKESKEQHAAAEGMLDKLREVREGEARQREQAVRKYERDIGKLRAALGDIRMKEILGT